MSLKILAAAALALALAACNPGPKTLTPVDGDSFLGAADAKVVVTEFFAPTCPACKGWHDANWSAFKAAYIDTGKIRFVFRELPSHNPPVDAAIFAVARCAGNDNYAEVIDEAFVRQADIEAASRSAAGPREAVVDLAAKVGLSAEQAEACIRDPKNVERIMSVQADADAKGVRGTPTFFINDREVANAQLAPFSAELDAAIAAAGAAPAPAP
jgi:protein-disulfide isomerase